MPTPIEIGTPVVSSRQWTTALAPRNGGGWNFITQSYQYPTGNPTEWVVVNLETGSYAVYEQTARLYSNSNFQIPSANTAITINNQLRASNGRIFFGESGSDTEANVAYYDPTDEQVHQLAPLTVGPYEVAAAFSAVVDHAGTWVYFGTQATGVGAPSVFRVNSSTLVREAICVVGSPDPGFPRYAYYLAKDEGVGSDWLYVACGQHGWQLFKVRISTGVATLMYTTSGPGFEFMSMGGSADGCGITIYDNGVATSYWLADGALQDGTLPVPAGGARNTIPWNVAHPLTSPPEIDWSRGIGQVLWRTAGSSGGYTLVEYEVTYRDPIPIESLIVLADGTVFGNAEQYQGFFNVLQWYGAWTSGLSRPTMAVVGELVYMAGYPNGELYSYNPAQTWAPDSTAAGNPSAIGTFSASGMKYATFLEQCSNGLLYCAGRLERDDEGSSIGTFDLASQTFGAVLTTGLEDYDPRGFVVMDSIERIVFSGELNDASALTTAELVVYDLAFNEVGRYEVSPGLTNTGALYETSDPEIVIGIVGTLIYRFNVVTGAVVTSVTAAATVGASAARYDNTVWAMIGDDLCRIDQETLAISTRATISGVTGMIWSDALLYYITTDTLWSLSLIDHIDPAILKPEAIIGRAAAPPEFYEVVIEKLNELAPIAGVATIDPAILGPGSTAGSALPLDDFFALAISKVNEIVEEAELDMAQLDPFILSPSAETGAADTTAEFYDALIESMNNIIDRI